MTPIRVLIADDHAVVRQGLRTFLSLQDGVEVVGDVADGAAAVAAVAEHRPDVVLMDLVMPEMDGVEAIRRIASEWRAAPAPSRGRGAAHGGGGAARGRRRAHGSRARGPARDRRRAREQAHRPGARHP